MERTAGLAPTSQHGSLGGTAGGLGGAVEVDRFYLHYAVLVFSEVLFILLWFAHFAF